MTLSATTPTTSLRSKVTTSLAVALIGPLLLLAVGLALWVPRYLASNAQDTAAGAARSAAVALQAKCEAVGEAATAAARQAASYAAVYGTIPQVAARAVAVGTVARRPDAAVAVFDADWAMLEVSGNPDGRRAAVAGGYDSACSAGLPGSDLRSAGLAERRDVQAKVDGRVRLVGHVALWMPLDDAALDALRADLGTGGELSVLGARDRVLASSLPAADRAPLTAVLTAVGSGEADATAGVVDGVGYFVREAGPGMPFPVVATVPVAGAGLFRALTLLALALGLLALLPIRALAARLSGPVDDELQSTAGELRVSRTALTETLITFGEALEHTHNLEKLLDAVAAACLHGTGAVAGMALLTDPEADVHRSAGSPRQARGTAADADPTSAPALAALPEFADRYLRDLSPSAPPEPLFTRVPEAGPVLAVPIRTADRVVGVLILARGQDGAGFDAQALPLVQAVADHAGTAIANVRLHEEVRRLSVTDPLTGVGNVRHLTTTLSREVAVATRFGRPVTVLMLDLDHFKQVNDTLGHQFGDVVLREFAHRVLACVREMDTVARYGGEEFSVVLPDTDIDGGCRVAERVINAVRAEPFRHGDLWQMVTVSIGVASFPGHGRNGTDVLHAADEALYTAKHEGRDRWEVAPPAPTAAAISQAG